MLTLYSEEREQEERAPLATFVEMQKQNDREEGRTRTAGGEGGVLVQIRLQMCIHIQTGERRWPRPGFTSSQVFKQRPRSMPVSWLSLMSRWKGRWKSSASLL